MARSNSGSSPPKQRKAIAIYVKVLPDLVELGHEDATVTDRAFRDVWSLEVGKDP